MPPTIVARTQMSVIVPVSTRWVRAERGIERCAVEAVVVELGHDELPGLGSQLGGHADVGLALEAGGRGQAEAALGARRRPPVLGMQQAHQEGRPLGVRELGEENG
jgi:hypothetical protein